MGLLLMKDTKSRHIYIVWCVIWYMGCCCSKWCRYLRTFVTVSLRAGPLPDNAVLVLHAQKAYSFRPKQTVTKSVWNIAWETYCFFVLFFLVLCFPFYCFILFISLLRGLSVGDTTVIVCSNRCLKTLLHRESNLNF